MSGILKNLLAKYFKFYFVLMLIGFVLMIFLMNVPRLLAADGGEIVARASHYSLKDSFHSSPPSKHWLQVNPLKWNVSKPTPEHLEETYFEFDGSKMNLTVVF